MIRYFTRWCFLMVLAVLLPVKLSAQYQVSGAEDPDINGMYVLTGNQNNMPLYSNGNYYLYYKDCTTKWAIGTVGNCPYYSTYVDGDVPDNLGWHSGGKYTGSIMGTVMVAKMNSLAFERNWLLESAADDGTFSDSLQILLNSVDNPFRGDNGEDFVASGKVVVTGVPEGLTMKVLRTGDYLLKVKISGTAVNHEASHNTSLTIAFQNNAFTDSDAGEIAYATYTGLKILFMSSFMAFGADLSPWVNDTFFLAGIYNSRPTYSNGEYAFIYKGCKWGTKWALTDVYGGCPEYSTMTDGDDVPSAGWYDGGQGDGTADTMYVARTNGILYSATKITESDLNDGSMGDSVVLRFFARSNGNAFTGNNGDDFITGGKATVTNVPEGLTPHIMRVNDTTLVFDFEGNATSHTYTMSVINITVSLLDAAFTGGHAGAVNNAVAGGFGIEFNQEVLVIGAHYLPDVNGIYMKTGTYNNAPVFSNGNYVMAYRNCTASWVIVEGSNPDNCPEYSTSVKNDKLPPYDGWSDGGAGGNGNDSIRVIAGNALVYSSHVFQESAANDGSVTDSVVIVRTFNTGMVNFSGENGDNFVADSKVVVTNLPEGFTATVTRKNDSILVMKLSGNATLHGFANNVSNLGVEFTNAAFTGGKAVEFYGYHRNDLSIIFLIQYEVWGSVNNPDMNGTYVSEGMHNGRIYLSKGEYRLGYRDCTTKWVIVDGDNETYINRGNCPLTRNYMDTEMPPFKEWESEAVQVYPHNSLLYSKTTITESPLNNGSIDNSDTLVINYFFRPNGTRFSGENGDDFAAGGKISISNLPLGLSISAIRSSDSTLRVTFSGNTRAPDVSDLTIAFTDLAFEGITASQVLLATRNDLEIDFHNEFLVASSGGDFATISEALQSFLVGEGDVLNLAAETFTEYDLLVDRALTLRGQGPGNTIVQAAASPGSNQQIFRLDVVNDMNTQVVFENMTLRNGRSDQSGGAIHSSDVDLIINNCEFVDNSSYNIGGAVYCYYGNVVIRNSTFAGNKSDISSTSSYYGGGAIALKTYDDDDKALIENCTFAGNSCQSHGGALFTSMNTTVMNSTFAGNSAYRAGAMYRYNYDLNLLNTLVANNTASNAGNDLYGTLNANYSLIENITGITIYGSNNITGTDPGLGNLADNGGTTRTFSIGALSAAADKGMNEGTPEADQRGILVFNEIKDIGAFEYNSKPVILISDTLISTTVVLTDSTEIRYALSAINLTSQLRLEASDNMEMSLTSGDAFVPETVILLDPTLEGVVSSTDVFVKIKSESLGQFTGEIIHASTGAADVVLVIEAIAMSKPEGGPDTLVIAANQTAAFSTGNFTFTDADGDIMGGILIVTPETKGDLEYNDINVTAGETCLDASKITFRPFENESGRPYAGFGFRLIDTRGLLSDSTYTMTIFVNNAPQVMNPIPDGNANVGTAYSYVIPQNTFGDADVGEVFTYSALLGDNSALPTWLTFVPATRTFSGTPVATGALTIRVTVTDELGAAVSDEFVLTINPASAINDPFAESISVFPNPTSGKVYITLAAGSGNIHMTIMGIAGEVFMNKTLCDERTEIDLSGYARGVYLMQLTNGQHHAIRRIMVH